MENNFTHTLEEGLKAKKNLIDKTGLTEDDFYPADEMYKELGIPEGSPMVRCSDGDSKSAFDLWNEWEFERLYADDYADYMIENGLI